MHWGCFFPFVFFLLIFGLLITNIILWKRRNGMYDPKNDVALTTLDNRLAKGEITIDEYNEIKETFKK